MIRNIIYFIISILLFFCATILYGIILNGTEVTLDEALIQKGIVQFGKVSIVVDRRNYKLNLYSDSTLVKSYKVVFGKHSGRRNKMLTDFNTPIGKYIICEKNSFNKYHKMLKINYPNENDLAEMLRLKTISKNEYSLIMESKNQFGCVENKLFQNGEIGIHGTGEYNFIFTNLPFAFNWTNGSVAVSNENIDELFSVVNVGTPVNIKY